MANILIWLGTAAVMLTSIVLLSKVIPWKTVMNFGADFDRLRSLECGIPTTGNTAIARRTVADSKD